MITQTGGAALASMRTKSSSRRWAIERASLKLKTPRTTPCSSHTTTSRARILPLTNTCSADIESGNALAFLGVCRSLPPFRLITSIRSLQPAGNSGPHFFRFGLMLAMRVTPLTDYRWGNCCRGESEHSGKNLINSFVLGCPFRL